MESRNDKSGYVKKLGISLLAGYLVTLVGIFLLALCLFLFQITEEIVDIGIIVIYVASRWAKVVAGAGSVKSSAGT